MKERMISGGRPTGKLHLGHYVGAFKTFVEMQENYENYFIISDLHMLTTKSRKKDIDTIFDNAINEVIDAIGMGVDPDVTSFYLQSQIPSLSHIYGIFQNYVNINRINNTPSLLEMSKHSNKDEVSLGLIAYPVMEAADVYSLDASIVPVGKDNIDHILITQEIIKYLNDEFNLNIRVPDYVTTDNNHIVGLDGSNKMSKSLNNAIYIRDNEEDVNKKIDNMKWTNSNDKELNVVLEYIKIFAPMDYLKILEMYNSNMIGEQEAKKILKESLNSLLDPMRKRMEPYVKDKTLAFEILYEGTKDVKKIVDNAMYQLRDNIGLPNLDNQYKRYARVRRK